MSTLTFRDNLPKFRRRYAAMRTKSARGRVLDTLCGTYGCSRKYLNKLLRGTRGYRPRRGRGSTYGEEPRKLLGKLWIAAGRPCAEYLRPMLGRTAEDYRALGWDVDGEALAQVMRMSVSTIGRALRREGVSWRRRNKSSGSNTLKSMIPECPGCELPERDLGTCQVDTVVLCGGDMSGSFFSICTLTDALTQWFECAPAWNHGGGNTARAVTAIIARLPFDIHHLHPDNGPEFINHVFIAAITRALRGGGISRSRPCRKNDNCRIEQKNGSVIREYFADIRFDSAGQLDALAGVCADIALYTNLFRPCKKLVSKRRRDGRGVKYVKVYDKPATPLRRLSALDHDDPRTGRYLELYGRMNSIALYRSIQGQLRRLVRELRSPAAGCGGIPPPPAAEPVSGSETKHGLCNRSVSPHLKEAVCS